MDKPTFLGCSVQQFLRDYWHKKPLLVRNAFPGFKALLSRDDLFALAQQDEVESRLIVRQGRKWRLDRGPSAARPGVDAKNWTLLVQGLNLHNDDADALLRRFRFLPDARLDDLMVSYATDGGGVGPHFDSYDVFLLQAHGKRRWQISSQTDLTLVENMPLKILKNFQAEEEFVLEPGDLLYLPPHYAHDGVAVGECMTYSVGFRAPSYQELGEGFLQFMMESIDLPGRYADPDLKATAHPAEMGSAMLERVAGELSKIRFTKDDVTLFLGEYLTEPKANVFFDRPRRQLSAATFAAAAHKRGIKLSRKSQMLYRGKHVFINGEAFVARQQDKRHLVMLADQRTLDGSAMAGVSADVLEAFYAWYGDGWLELR